MQYGIKVYTSDEVEADIETVIGEKTIGLQRMKRQQIGAFSVIPFRVPHDETECDGWLIDTPDGRILFITDAEYCPYDFSKMHINYGLIECNYSEDYISRKEDGAKFSHVLTGHMELQTCKRLIQKINNASLRSIGLIHLSVGNGNPVMFVDEIQQIVDCDVDVWAAEKGMEKEFRLMPF